MGWIPEDACWYLAELVVEYRLDDEFYANTVHTNTHLIQATSPDEAYRKAMALGREGEYDYPNTDGQTVHVRFHGLRSLLVIYEPLEDGAELMYSEAEDVPEQTIRSWIPPREELPVFVPWVSPFPPSKLPYLRQLRFGWAPDEDLGTHGDPPSPAPPGCD